MKKFLGYSSDLELEVFLESMSPRKITLTKEILANFIKHLQTVTVTKRIPFKNREVEKLFCLLKSTMQLYQLKTVEELMAFCKDLNQRTGILANKYQEGSIIDKLELEMGFADIYKIPAHAKQVNRTTKSFFNRTTDHFSMPTAHTTTPAKNKSKKPRAVKDRALAIEEYNK